MFCLDVTDMYVCCVSYSVVIELDSFIVIHPLWDVNAVDVVSDVTEDVTDVTVDVTVDVPTNDILEVF